MKCEKCGGKPVYVVVGGCWKYMHVSEYYYCQADEWVVRYPHYCKGCLRELRHLYLCDEVMWKKLDLVLGCTFGV